MNTGVSNDRDAYKSRDYNLAGRMFIASHVARVSLLQERHLLPPNWRQWVTEGLPSVFSPERCEHVHRTLIEVATAHGVWGMEICASCGEQVAKECPHIRLTWHDDGQVLICDNCGVDGT